MTDRDHPIADWCRECGCRGPCRCEGRDNPHTQQVERYDSLFKHYAYLVGLGWRRIKQQAIVESLLNPRAVSPAGAMGLMQFMPGTWAEWGEGDPFDPEASISAGCRYMRFLFDRFGEIPAWDERYKFALAAYNAGRGNINRCLEYAREATGAPRSYAEWVRQGEERGDWQLWRVASQHLHRVTGKHAQETINYVKRVVGVAS